MLISEIPFKRVRGAAEKNVRDLPPYNPWVKDRSHLEWAFDWSKTPEGEDFWCLVDDKEWESAAILMPNLFGGQIVKIAMPPLPLGWRYTGEYRKSVKGVDYIYCDGKVVLSRGQELEYPIVTRVSE